MHTKSTINSFTNINNTINTLVYPSFDNLSRKANRILKLLTKDICI